MRSSRTRRYRRQASPQPRSMQTFTSDEAYRDVDIITADQLKDGAVAELTPPSGQQSLGHPLPAVPDEDSELAMAALPAAAIVSEPETRPTPNYLRQTTPRTLEVLDKDAYVRQATPMQIPVAAVVKVGGQESAVVSSEAEALHPIQPIFAEPETEEALDDEEEFAVEAVEDDYQEARDPMLAETVTREYQAASTARGILLPLLMFVFGLCVGICAMQWQALLQFYAQWF